MNQLQISLIQIPTIWEDPSANILQISKLIREIPSSDLIVLPEMWSTGFSMNTNALAEKMNGPTVSWMLEMAHQKNAAVAGSIIIEENQKFYNRLIFAMPNQKLEYYDKRHCFSLAKEDQFFQPGEKRSIVQWRGWNICLQICYDLRFPAWSRYNNDYDLLLYVAQFPSKRRYAWTTLLPARAIENVCYAVGVNGIGNDGNGMEYAGDSMIVDYEGLPVLQMGSDTGCKTGVLNHEKLLLFRRAYPFLNDRDKIIIS